MLNQSIAKSDNLIQFSYLQRERCPACFASTQQAYPQMQSIPPAENISIHQHGKFLSGYTNHRIFFSYFRCAFCQLLFCPIYFTQEQLDQLYKHQFENMAEVPLAARTHTQHAYYKLLNQYPAPTGNYLEIGADIGIFSSFFVSNTQIEKLFLYEPNCDVHDALKKNIGKKVYKILTKSYEANDIKPSSLSIAVIIHALDHMLEPRKIIRDIYQNLKAGGIIFIVTHDESSFLARILGKKWPPYTLQHPQLFRPTTIQSLLTEEGFQILACKKTANYFPLTHFLKGGLTALGLEKNIIPNFDGFIIPIKLGNIATIAQKPWSNSVNND